MKNEKERLRWFLNFLYIDVDSLPRADFFKLITELGAIAHNPMWTSMGTLEIPWVDSKRERQEVKEYQEHLKKVLDNILALRELHPMFEDWWKKSTEHGPTHKITKRGPMEDIHDTIMRLKKEGKYEDVVKKLDLEMLEAEALVRRMEELSFKLTMTVSIKEDRVFLFPTWGKDSLTAEFVNSLNPFSLNDIRKCEREDCRKYFLKATQREKRYCSKRCMWVVFSRNRRKADPDKERAKNRQSYIKQKKRELGPNVKVRRRKRRED